MESSIGGLAELSETTQREARDRFELAMKEAYSFALANVGANIDGKLDSVEKSLLLSAQRKDLPILLQKEDTREEREGIDQYFRDLIETHSLASVALVDDSGLTLIRMDKPELSEGPIERKIGYGRSERRKTLLEPWFIKALGSELGETSWQAYSMSETELAQSRSVIAGTIPIPNSTEKTKTVGYLQFSLPVEGLAEVIHGPDELTSAIRLVDESGVVRWLSEGAEQVNAETRALFISQTIREGALIAEVSIPQEMVNANLAPFNMLSAAMDEDVARIREQTEDLRLAMGNMSIVMLLVKIALLAIAVTLVWMLLSRIASRIELLNKGTMRIQEGNLDIPVILGDRDEKGDELDSLGVVVEEMRLRIKASITKLDKQVEERTAELASTNRMLEKEIVERRKAEEQASAANSAKSEFLATMSHEIRTPLNGIFGGISLISKSELNNEQETLCGIVMNSTKTLNALVDDILDLAKIEARRVELSVERFDVANTVREVCDTLLFKANEKNVELSVENELEDLLLREGDPTRVSQIIYNLVGNAVKFTNKGKISVRLSTSYTDPDFVNIQIEDTGIGMSEEQVKGIFDPFTQADSTINGRFGGTGLGLAICSRLAEQMDGKIEVESKVGEGSTFSLVLKLQREGIQSSSAADEKDDDLEIVEQFGGRILLAEDNSSNRLVMSKVLSQAGFTVSAARNGKECVEAYDSDKYDLILLDCAMPVMDGYTAAQSIRSMASGGDSIPILGITAHATSDQQKRCEAAGMNEVLFKPLDGAVLVESCRKLVSECRV
ncbi:ATP-binding protein [Puniceicoccaceae bacterium K14]|nr:ATP-binding protein [Puniceicoccaceae bacterium K14]